MPKQGQWLQPEGEGREEGGREEGSPNLEREGGMEGGRRHPFNSIARAFGMAVQGVRSSKRLSGWAYSETVVSQGTTLMQRVKHSPGS